MNYTIPILVGLATMGLVGYFLGESKNRAALGCCLGLALGPLGWLILIVIPDPGPKCPHCLSRVNSGATKCKHCGSDLRKNNFH